MVRVLGNAQCLWGLLLIGFFATVALLAGEIAPYNPAVQTLSEDLQPPRAAHLFGQDKLGRDVLSRVVYGARVSLLVGLMVVGISATIGLGLGALAGYAGGWTDELVTRSIDTLLAFPGVLL